MNANLKFHPVVAAALADQRPVVALELTLITHGLPYPANVETALAMEEAVRARGRDPGHDCHPQGSNHGRPQR